MATLDIEKTCIMHISIQMVPEVEVVPTQLML